MSDIPIRRAKPLFFIAALTISTIALANDVTVAGEKVALAKSSLQRAEQAGAPQAAPVELAGARDKLARAEKDLVEHNPKPAIWLAEQANIDAQVAEATADQQRAHKAALEFDASMNALRQEATRNSTSAQ
jgi:Domain of unknown function (DUF4398)